MEANLTTAALTLGLIFGSVMLGVTCIVYYKRQIFSLGGSVLTVFGVVLLGLSIWKTVDVSISPTGGIEAKFSAVERRIIDQVQKTGQVIEDRVEKTGKAVETKVSALLSIDRLRNNFRNARNRLRDSGVADFAAAETDIGDLFALDKRNGHALYYRGETTRIKATDKFDPKSCPKKIDGEAFSFDPYEEDFYVYIENERNLAESEKGGDLRAEICYTRTGGYCRQRTGWIHHLLANDFYSQASRAVDSDIRREKLQRALDHARKAQSLYPPSGFDQCVPTKVIVANTGG